MIEEDFRAAVDGDVLFAAGVDADDPHAHAPGGDLRRHVAQSAPGAEEHDPVARQGAGFAEGGEDGDAGAEPASLMC